MIDFTNCIEYVNKFEGSEKKKTIEYDGKVYLLKFPDPTREQNKALSYINNTVSEYVGCKIYESAGIDTQQVLLGIYRTGNGDKKIVCACEDFTDGDLQLYEYKRFQLANIDSVSRNELELDRVLEDIKGNGSLQRIEGITERFWDMFVMDAFIGNQDRHTGNWGFLGRDKKIVKLAPVFDCGSCLSPLLSDEIIKSMLKSDYKNNAINVYSCYRENGKRIHALNYILSAKNEECNRAVQRLVPQIDMDKISQMIAREELISGIRKDYYMEILNIRYQDILEKTLKSLEIRKDQ